MTLNIEEFGITADRGFLTPYNMDEVSLPEAFAPLLEAGKHLSDYMGAGRVRYFLDQLPEVEIEPYLESMEDAQLRMLMVHFSFIV